MTSRRSIARAALTAGALWAAFTFTGNSDGATRHATRSATKQSAKRLHLRRISTLPAEAHENPGHFVAWLKSHLPPGGAVSVTGGVPTVVHTTRDKGETWLSIADAYLDLSTVYSAQDLAKAIVKANLPRSKKGLVPGMELTIPHLVAKPYASSASAERIGLPQDHILKGVYVRGDTAADHAFPTLIDRLAERGMNAIVLDVKDYDGKLTFASRVPLAIETGATKRAPIHSYAHVVRYAHSRGIRVVARISCFEDENLAKKRPDLSVRGRLGGPYGNGWVDPKNPVVQQYVVDLAKEAMDAGVDEVELDYVRYPVVGVKNANFGLDLKENPRARVEVISRFVDRVHAVTKARGVPLSLDVFGVIAFGRRVDIEALGQDPPELATRAEFLSAMVYPSHYDPGFMGYESPGDHPELVGIGVKRIQERIHEAGVRGGAQIRPWLQAMNHKSPTYGPGYIQTEIRSSDEAGGRGWLLWNSGQTYGVAWRAIPKVSPDSRDK